MTIIHERQISGRTQHPTRLPTSTTRAGTGVSTLADTAVAAAEAVRQARATLGALRPTFGVLFAGPDHDLARALAVARATAGIDDVVAATTAGELTERGLVHGGVCVMLVAAGDSTSCVRAQAAGLRSAPELVAEELAPAGGLRGVEQRHLTTILLADGLTGAGERLVASLHDVSPPGTQIVGGAAGDEGRFVSTQVGVGRHAGSDRAVALHVSSAHRWGVGVKHGLTAASKPMRVTKAEGSVVFELDGEPAFTAYQRHAARRGVGLTRDNAAPYLIANELGILFFDKIARARAPLGVGPDGSLRCAADVPKGAMVSILDGEPGAMIAAARAAAEEAKRHLDGRRAAAVLLFDCVCRGMILGARFEEEIAAVRSVLGDVPVAGFLTYGEIARYQGSLDGWHNTTAVVVAIPE